MCNFDTVFHCDVLRSKFLYVYLFTLGKVFKYLKEIFVTSLHTVYNVFCSSQLPLAWLLRSIRPVLDLSFIPTAIVAERDAPVMHSRTVAPTDSYML